MPDTDDGRPCETATEVNQTATKNDSSPPNKGCGPSPVPDFVTQSYGGSGRTRYS